MRGKKDWKVTFVRWVLTLGGLAVALIPVWLYIVARIVLSPQGFWQQLVLGVVFLTFLSFIQLVLLVLFLLVWLPTVWD